MNNKAFVLVVILATIMAFGLVSIAFASVTNGPQTPKMEIHIYTNPDTENADLQAKVLDLNDWPLSKEWIDAWALMPDTITMDSYVELGMDGIGINNQQWPTGDSANKFYTPTAPMANRSIAFRQAVTLLTDKDSVITNILKGYGIKMITPLPPFQSAYQDMLNYSTATINYEINGAFAYQLNASVGGITYPFNPALADMILDKAGFTMDLSTGYRFDPMNPGHDLAPIVFYIRQDDPERLQMGQMVAQELKNNGIPVNEIVTAQTVCYKNVMVLYSYNLYTEGWSLSLIPFYHDGYSSSTYYGPATGWSTNYPGFCNHEFDTFADESYYPATLSDAVTACINCGYVFLQYCANMPVYCHNAVKAYTTGDTGVINNAGSGIDNYYTFLNGIAMDGTWDYGFKNDIQTANQISAQWLWDQDFLGLMYESLMGTNPFNLALTEFWIAQSYTIVPWNATAYGGDAAATSIQFVLRNNVYWHNNDTAGRNLNATDVKFSLDFTKACGAGVAWNAPSLTDYNGANVTGTYSLTVYFNHQNAWALLQASGIPIVNPDLWNPMWNPADPLWQTKVRTYDPMVAHNGGYADADIYHDGTGAWIFGSYSKGNYITLIASTYYYLNSTTVSSRLADMFWAGAGDVNKDGVVNTQDLGLMARALFTNSTFPLGTGWGMWNPNCDLDGNLKVDSNDLAVVTTNYGKTAG